MTAETLKTRGMIVAGVGAAGTAVGFATGEAAALYPAWLFSFMFVISFPLGSLGLLTLNQLVAGGWGQAAEPIFRAAIKTLPLLIVPFVVVVVGIEHLYPWADAAHVQHDPILLHKARYLNRNGFVVRSAAYFGIFISIGLALERSRSAGRAWPFAGPAVLLFGLTSSFAAIDWGMSLEPHWYSTIYPLIVIVGYGLAGFCLALFVGSLRFEQMPDMTIDRFHDLAKLLFAFVMLWGYGVFSQLLIVWSGNLAEEAPWYIRRSTGGWEVVAAFIFLFGFALPWLTLLSKHVKRNVRVAGLIAAWMIFIRVVENLWFVLPASRGAGLRVTMFDIAVPLLLGGAWTAAFAHFLTKASKP